MNWTHEMKSDRRAADALRANLSDWERVGSLSAGVLLMAASSRDVRGRSAAAIAAGGLLLRGLTGFCPVSAALGRDRSRANTRAALGGRRGLLVSDSITINRPVADLYEFWRTFSNLPSFMSHLAEVRIVSPTRSVWTATAPAGLRVTWEADVINEVPNALIGWQSTRNTDIATAGSVRFKPAPGGGTQITVRLQYEPPAGRLGAQVAALFGEDPARQIREDLRRLKALVETGETPSVTGQPVGPHRTRLAARAVRAPG